MTYLYSQGVEQNMNKFNPLCKQLSAKTFEERRLALWGSRVYRHERTRSRITAHEMKFALKNEIRYKSRQIASEMMRVRVKVNIQHKQEYWLKEVKTEWHI